MSPAPAPRGDGDVSLAAAPARRVHRPSAAARQPRGVHRGGADPRRRARPRAVRGPARARQDHALPDRGARARRRLPPHLGADHRQRRRPRRDPHQLCEPRDVLFIDEIHRLQPAVEEILYPAMEDFKLDLIIGEGPRARSIRSTCRASRWSARPRAAGLLTAPLATGSASIGRLEFYREELEEMCCAARAARARAPARRRAGDRAARPRHAARRRPPAAPGARLRRRRGDGLIDAQARDSALRQLEVDERAWTPRPPLPARDRTTTAAARSASTPSAALSEQRDTLEESVEPFLLQQGFIQRTPRGRLLTRARPGSIWASTPRGARRAGRPVRGRGAHEPAVRPPGPATTSCRSGLLRGHRRRGIVYHANFPRSPSGRGPSSAQPGLRPPPAGRRPRAPVRGARYCEVDFRTRAAHDLLARSSPVASRLAGCGRVRAAGEPAGPGGLPDLRIDLALQAGRRGDDALLRTACDAFAAAAISGSQRRP